MKDNKPVKPSSIMDDIQTEGKQMTDFSKVCKLLMDEQWKRRKTILNNNRQVAIITTLDVIADLCEIPFLRAWVDNFAEWRTSGDKGQGRKDIVDISKFSFSEQQKRDEKLFDILRGGTVK